MIGSLDAPWEVRSDKVDEHAKLQDQEDQSSNPAVFKAADDDKDEDDEEATGDKVSWPRPTEELVNEELPETPLDSESDQDVEHSDIEHHGRLSWCNDEEGQKEERH